MILTLMSYLQQQRLVGLGNISRGSLEKKNCDSFGAPAKGCKGSKEYAPVSILQRT